MKLQAIKGHISNHLQNFNAREQRDREFDDEGGNNGNTIIFRSVETWLFQFRKQRFCREEKFTETFSL